MSIFLHRSFLSYKIYPKKKCANRGKFFTFKVLNGHKKQTTLEITWAGRKEWASKFSWLQTSCKVESQQTLKILSIILKAIFNLGKWKLFSIMGFSELNIATSHNWARFHSFVLFSFLNGHTTNDYKHTTEDRTQEWWNFVARKLLKSMCPMRKQITLLYFFFVCWQI